MNGARTASRTEAFVAAALFALKLGVCATLVAYGFRQISDDDYARTVIAQSFAHAPKLDPSGTSWLPFPFWLTGGAMLAFGRSLAVARGVAWLAAAGITAAFYLTLRKTGLDAKRAALACVVASFGAWHVWLGAATVPEGFTAGLVAVGAFGLVGAADEQRGPPWWAALAMLAAGLSRYEAWPACGVFAGCTLLRAARSRRLQDAAPAAVVLLAPFGWMAWNAVAHGHALHFLARVSNYRRALGAAGAPTSEKLLVYPLAFARAFPEALAALPAAFFGARALGKRALVGPVGVAAGVVLFLVAGELGEGAPTHHPERALGGVAWIVLGLAALGTALRSRMAMASIAVAMLVFVARVPTTFTGFPGRGEADRTRQLDLGKTLAREAPGGFDVVPCSYEHFATIAAYGAPERVRIEQPLERTPITEKCPRVSVRP